MLSFLSNIGRVIFITIYLLIGILSFQGLYASKQSMLGAPFYSLLLGRTGI